MAGVWTNNWRAFRNIMLMGSHHNGLSTVVNTDGVTVADRFNENISATSPVGVYFTDLSGTNSGGGIRLGTGNTPPSATDYNLESSAPLNYLTCATTTPVYNDQDGTITRTVTISVQNQTGNPVTIREWGVYGTVRTVVYYSNAVTTALLYREVLDSPVTLANYQTATVEVTLTLTLTDPVA